MALFGTDGVRGLANGPLTADLALTLAQATAVVLGQGRIAEARKAAGKRLTAVVARDPRISGQFLSAAVEAGLASSGVDVLDAGTLPTPAAAFLIGDIDADFGVMISASHNPAPDNGIKIFARGGVKLPAAHVLSAPATLSEADRAEPGARIGSKSEKVIGQAWRARRRSARRDSRGYNENARLFNRTPRPFFTRP